MSYHKGSKFNNIASAKEAIQQAIGDVGESFLARYSDRQRFEYYCKIKDCKFKIRVTNST